MAENSVKFGEKGLEFTGKLNSETAKTFSEQLDKIIKDIEGPLPGLIFENLEDISPAGVHVLLKLRDKFDQVNIFKANDNIYDFLTKTKALAKFNVVGNIVEVDPDKLKDAAQRNIGAASNILDIGHDRVIKKYNEYPFAQGYKLHPLVFDEFLNMQNMFANGIPSPIAETMVKIGDNYGIVMEKIDGKDFGDYMLKDMDNAPKYVHEYVKFVNQASPREVPPHKFPNHKDIIYHLKRIIKEQNIEMLDGDVFKKMEEIIGKVKDDKCFIQGDNHLRNVMIDKERNMYYIDNGFCGYGNPIWDMLSMYTIYGCMTDEDTSRGMSLAIATLNQKQGHYVYDLYCKEYLGTEDEKIIEQVKKDVEVLTWIVHTIRFSIYVPHLPDYEPARQAGFSQIKKVVEDYYANGLHTIGI